MGGKLLGRRAGNERGLGKGRGSDESVKGKGSETNIQGGKRWDEGKEGRK